MNSLVLGMRAAVAVRVLLLGGAALMTGAAPALSASPYHTSFRTTERTDVHVEMDPSSQSVGVLPRGQGGLRLVYCEPGLPVAAWEEATPDGRRDLLASRWCEVDAGSLTGNVDGRMLAPE